MEIINTLDRGDITLKKVVKLTKLFAAYLLVLLNKYRGPINILRVTSKMCLGIITIFTSWGKSI